VSLAEPPYDPLRLRAEIEQSRLDLIKTDLDVCLTFAKIAETAISMGHWEHAERTIANAEKGYSDMPPAPFSSLSLYPSGLAFWLTAPRPARVMSRRRHGQGGELEQIQFLLGHVSVETTERYLGCEQRLRQAVNDKIGPEP
jgi:hypothetical protein